jgi:two-component sensor histidine kinase/putative methionine-R-sulfoxide reductase with GAF domain
MTLVMGLFGVAFILLTFGYIAWEQRNRLIQRNQEDIASNAYFLADHAARLLEVTDLTLKQTIGVIEGMSWNDIQTSETLWQQLRAVQEALPYVDNVWLSDASGKLRLTTAEFPAPNSNVARRDAFNVQARSDRGLFVGEPIIGAVTKEPTFLISRRLQKQDGSFDGIASVTVALSYLNDYWGKLRLPKGSRVTLLRGSDAKVIAQYPAPQDGLTFFPIDKAAFDQAVGRNALSGSYAFLSQGVERMGAYRRIADMPLYINVSMPEDAYWAPWTVQMRLYGAFALIALVALLALTSLAYQQFYEQAATEALLQREVSLRTGELKAETAALEVLNRTGRALAAELDIERIVENVVEAAVLLTGAQTGIFFSGVDSVSPNEDGRPGIHYGHYAPGGARTAFSDLAVDKICEAVFEHGRTIRIDDISVDPDHKSYLNEESLSQGRPRIRGMLAVPVSSRTGKIYGVLLFAHEKAGAFTERAERLVTGLAAQAAIALENGRLYQEAQHEIEERRQAQNQQSFLIRELHHRVKNTLATVQAVVGATARSTSSIEEFYKAFVGRIISLANTHSLLTEALWQTASLREILEKELIPYNDARGERIELEGPDVKLPSEIAVPIGMAIHELTTNAAKYGALSMRSGKVSVMWSVYGEGDDKRLSLSWVERGGPRVAQPGRQGFGSRLLHRVLTTQLNAEVKVDYDPTGLRVSIDAPIKATASLSPPV